MTHMQLTSLRLAAAPTASLRCFRKNVASPMRAFHTSRRWKVATERQPHSWTPPRRQQVRTAANRSPNPYGGGDDDAGSLLLDLALPALGVVALVSVAGPLIGGLAATLGLPLAVTAIAAALGLLDPIAAALGATPLVAAGVVASSTLGILLIPSFLKLGLFMAAGYFVANFLFGTGGPLGPPEPEIDARDVTIDVDATTIDD